MKMVRYNCPSCDMRLESPDRLAGKQDVCPACGNPCTVPQTPAPRRSLRLVGLVGGAIAIIVAAAVVILHDRGGPNRSARTEEADTPPRQEAAAGRSFTDLTVEDVFTYAKRRGLTPVAGLPVKNQLGERQDWGAWETQDELHVRCLWFPGPDKRIKTLWICRNSASNSYKPSPDGQAMVVAAWQGVCPPLVQRFRKLFKTTTHQYSTQLHWIGDTPYACGVLLQKNAAFVEYIGPQSEIKTRREYAIMAAGTKVNWFNTIMASQKRLQAALKASPGEKESLELVKKEMSQFSVFKDMRASEAWLTETLVRRYSSPQSIVLNAGSHINPESIPAQLPEETRLKLFRIATEIAAVARLTRFLVQRGDTLVFNPYEHMIMAFGEHPGVVRSVWGQYARLEGFKEWGQLPQPLAKENEKVTFAALACVMSATEKKKGSR